MYYTYILQSELTGHYYIGSTRDAYLRLVEHNDGRTPSTRNKRPWKLIYSESHRSLAEARQRELRIKSWKNPAYMLKTLGLCEKGERPD